MSPFRIVSVLLAFLIPLATYAADVNARLIEAVRKGDTATVQALLDQGADINAKSEEGWTALIWAAQQGHTDTVQTLLAHGADVNAKDDHGWTTLMRAAVWGHSDVVTAAATAG